MELHSVLLAPIITEKTEALKRVANGGERHTFRVHRQANKELITQALRYFYQVDAVKVNIINMPGKLKRFRRDKVRQPALKKAIVTLARGQSLELESAVGKNV